MTQEEIKHRIIELQEQMNNVRLEIDLLRLKCTHENTFEGLYS